MRKFWYKIKDYVIIVIVVVLIRTFLATPAIVSGASMDHTLEDGQLVIINKISYKIYNIKRFDIVVLKNEEGDDRIIKRVIGLPNEKIEFKENKLYINDRYVEAHFDYEYTNDFVATTGDGEYFVMGDNRGVSKDSRMLGNFKKNDIIGQVHLRIYPFNKIGFVD